MPWGIAAGVVGSVAGAAVSSAMSPSGGGTSESGGQPYYTPSGLGDADAAWQNLLQQQMGIYGQSGAHAAGYENAALDAGMQYSNLAGLANIYSGQMGQRAGQAYGAQNYLQGVGQDVYNLARDPQNALYNRTQQQLTDQVNAGQALRGLGNSAVGGSEYNQAMSNFNIDWQNQQLQRALSGAQGLSGLYGQAGNYAQLGNADINQSMQLGALTPQYQLQAGQVPYQTSQNITNNQLSQAQGIQGMTIPYMNYGQGAVQNAYAAGSQNAGAAGALVNQGIQGLGSAAQNYFSGSGGGFGYTGQGSLFGGQSAGMSSGYGASPVTGMSSGVNYGMGTNYGFG